MTEHCKCVANKNRNESPFLLAHPLVHFRMDWVCFFQYVKTHLIAWTLLTLCWRQHLGSTKVQPVCFRVRWWWIFGCECSNYRRLRRYQRWSDTLETVTGTIWTSPPLRLPSPPYNPLHSLLASHHRHPAGWGLAAGVQAALQNSHCGERIVSEREDPTTNCLQESHVLCVCCHYILFMCVGLWQDLQSSASHTWLWKHRRVKINK